jgi:hypothetical protein
MGAAVFAAKSAETAHPPPEPKRFPCGPEWRKVMRASQLGDLLEHCGGDKQVLAAALAAVRRGR